MSFKHTYKIFVIVNSKSRVKLDHDDQKKNFSLFLLNIYNYILISLDQKKNSYFILKFILEERLQNIGWTSNGVLYWS